MQRWSSLLSGMQRKIFLEQNCCAHTRLEHCLCLLQGLFSVHCFSCGLQSTPQRPHEGLANSETTMHTCSKQAMHVQTKMFRQQPWLAFSTRENALIVFGRDQILCFEQILLLPSSPNVRPQGLLPRETGLGCDLRSHYLDRGPWSASLLSKGMVLLYRLQW